MSPSFAPASISAAITSVYAVIASCTPWIVVSRSSTIREIDTFMTLLSSTITNCAAASTAMGSQVGDDRASGCAAAAGRATVMAAAGSRPDARRPGAPADLALHVDAALDLVVGRLAQDPVGQRAGVRDDQDDDAPRRGGAGAEVALEQVEHRDEPQADRQHDERSPDDAHGQPSRSSPVMG